MNGLEHGRKHETNSGTKLRTVRTLVFVNILCRIPFLLLIFYNVYNIMNIGF